MNKLDVIQNVSRITEWWVEQRTKKILQSDHGTMEINPFLAPLLCFLHEIESIQDLSDFVTAGHFYIGHGTGFGKLIDEKILPLAFSTQKLDKAFRKNNGFDDPAFDDIDHIVTKNGKIYLLSQKASKWTIQLGQAMGLNKSFKALIERRERGLLNFEKIVVGVFYGHNDDLTDKYRILRGITTGAAHDVVDISNEVDVYAGRAFWGWLADAPEAQEWVMLGILGGIKKATAKRSLIPHLANSGDQLVSGSIGKIGDLKTEEDWVKFINLINY
jgi:hypothetical protein